MIECELKGKKLRFNTSDKVFSPSGPDRGTLAMLSKADFTENQRVLDLGCGYGIVGILAASCGCDVTMCDISGDAVNISTENACLNGVSPKIIVSDGFRDIYGEFDFILSNPPYHEDFSVAKGFIENGFRHLCVGGKMLMVTKRREWYKNKLISVFGGVKIDEIDGYFVFSCEKREKVLKPKKEKVRKLSKKLEKKMENRKK